MKFFELLGLRFKHVTRNIISENFLKNICEQTDFEVVHKENTILFPLYIPIISNFINKFIAKVASDINKPNGQKTINPEEVIPFLETLDIRKFYGIGKVTAEKMYLHGIFTGNDLKSKSLEYLEEHFGKSGTYYYHIVRGIHNSEVKPHRTRKSLGAERTFSENITSELFMMERLEHIAEEIERRLEKSNVAGKTVTLKIKYSDFTLQTRSKTLPYYLRKKEVILETAKELLYQDDMKNSVRLLGISLSNLNTEDRPKAKPSLKKEIVKKMDRLGVDNFRINISHIEINEFEKIVEEVIMARQNRMLTQNVCLIIKGIEAFFNNNVRNNVAIIKLNHAPRV